MSSHFLAQFLLLLLLAYYADFVNSKVHYITPSESQDRLCLRNGSSCFTFSQFAANSSNNETHVSLLFLPGHHTLDQELLLARGHNFSMSKYAKDNETVFIECISQLGRFDISETIFASIKGLNFIGCGSNRVSWVTWLMIADSTFQGVENLSKVLVICNVSTTKIVRSMFLNNTLEHYDSITGQNVLSHEETLDYIYHQRNTSNGVLYTAYSNVSVVSCRFMLNRADIGGALVAHNSSLHIERSTLSYNKANFGGAMVTSGSTIDISNSIFTHNSAQYSGGVMVTYNDRVSIRSSEFPENIAVFDYTDGGVMMTFGNSSFTISNSNFTSNRGGVMITSGDSSFNISNSNFTSNRAIRSGVMYTSGNSSFTISNTDFISNRANIGGVMFTFGNSSFNISNSNFTSNSAIHYGGVLFTFDDSSFTISNSNFTFNSATSGGVMFTSGDSSFTISNSNFTSNIVIYSGGVVYTSDDSSFTISDSNFTSNSANGGGVMYTSGDSLFTISNSNFTFNSANGGGVMHTAGDSSFTISNSNFTSNSAATNGGVMITYDDSSFSISNSNFTFNSANYSGGIMVTSGDSSFNISNSSFTSNSAATNGGVMVTSGDSSFNISNNNFTSNHATSGGVMYTSGDSSFNISNSSFTSNSVATNGGVMVTSGDSSFNISNNNFTSNHATSGGVMYTSGDSSFSISNSNFTSNSATYGGVMYIYNDFSFSISNSSLTFNSATSGGALLVIESTIIINGETTIANNNITAIANSIGGGISLKQSRMEIRGKCNVINNSAVRGGGIRASSSIIAVYQPGSLQLINNNAEFGGGMYLEVNSKLYVLKASPIYTFSSSVRVYFINFTDNNASYGGAVYVADDTNSGTCLPDNDCFIQSQTLYQSNSSYLNTVNILLSENKATEQGSDLFGGLLDRCRPSPFAEVYQKRRIHYSGVTYLQNITNLIQLHSRSISSQPVRVCFCNSKRKPDCSYLLPTITVKKGEAFNVSVVAVDQVNNIVDANIITTISSSDGGIGEGQQTQSVGRNCTDLTYNVYSPHENETINVYADGPCGSAALSISQVTIVFNECTCPVGFQPLSNSRSSTRCECICDSELSPYITDCDIATSLVFRLGTNSWITYINNTDSPGSYVKYSYCPFDYCKPLTENVSINFNLPNGAETQCAHNRTGVLCGSCRGKSTLSLASSRCLPCHSHWPAVCVIVFVAAILAGVLLVISLLALNMTVSVGLINGFIFYANIVSAGSAIFFPSSEPSFPSVFVAWLNLDIGIDVCFIDGLDTYIKTWLQLVFTMYIIFLVVIVIIVGEYSPRFAKLIGRRDPVSTLATLILISYAKLLSIIITALSFATLDYPDGKQEIVWLPDGNVKYFQGKHIPLALVALLIVISGLPYTILLFLWQWIVRAPRWKVFKWTRNTKLNAFIATYHVPHNSEYRYWTGLLLLVRVVLYVTASVTISANPQTFPLISIILMAGLLFSKIFSQSVYKNSFINVVNTVLYFNILVLSAFSLYDFKVDPKKQTVVAYTSTSVTFILFIGSIIYHVKLLFKKEIPPQDLNEYPLAPLQPAHAQVTYSVIEPPKRDQDARHAVDKDRDGLEISCRNVTP